MGLIIDTNIFINVENQRLNSERLSTYGEAYIAAITVSELLAGVSLAKTTSLRIHRSAFTERVITNFSVLDFNEEVARTYAELYAHFLKPSNHLRSNTHDLQIAATAITHGFAVLTSNVSDFKQIPGLKVEEPF